MKKLEDRIKPQQILDALTVLSRNPHISYAKLFDEGVRDGAEFLVEAGYASKTKGPSQFGPISLYSLNKKGKRFMREILETVGSYSN